LLGTPIDLGRVLRMDRPLVRVRYEVEEVRPGSFEEILAGLITETASVHRGMGGSG
jgi:predicted GTPase